MPGPLSATRPLLAGLLLLALLGCNRAPPQVLQQESYVFGTRVQVVVAEAPSAETPPAEIQAGLREFLQRLDQLHQRYHPWHTSELSQLNAALKAGKSHRVDPEMRGLITRAQDYETLSDGLFNPSVGELIKLWGFQRDDAPQEHLPLMTDLESARQSQPRMSQLHWQGQRITSTNAHVQIDFGGQLKGYALDEGAAILHRHHINNALINIGGNIMALGNKFGEPWRVGLRHPRAPGAMAEITLQDGEAIGTSGDYQRYFELQGKRYCHIIDPRTAWPAQGMQSVTLITPPGPHAGERSDVLSKPLFVGGAAALGTYAQRFGLKHVLALDAQGQAHVTPALAQRLRWIQKPEVVQTIVLPDKP